MSIFTAGRHSNTVFEASQQPLASTDSLYMCSPTGWQVVACRCKEVTLLQWKTSLWFLRSPVVCTNTDQRVLKQWKVWCKAETVKVKLASFDMWWSQRKAPSFTLNFVRFWFVLHFFEKSWGAFADKSASSKQTMGDQNNHREIS